MPQLRNHTIVRKQAGIATDLDDWRDRSACRDADAEIFFPHPTDTRGQQEALDHCAVCPVLQQCKETAYQRREEFGVFGGETEAERRANLKAEGHQFRIIPDCGTEAGAISHRRRREPVCPACSSAASKARAARAKTSGVMAATRILADGPNPCGTPNGYWRHVNNAELPCTACLEARRAHNAKAKQARQDGETAVEENVCGERRGYRRHRARGEEPCGPCVEANRAYNRSKRYPKRAA